MKERNLLAGSKRKTVPKNLVIPSLKDPDRKAATPAEQRSDIHETPQGAQRLRRLGREPAERERLNGKRPF